MPGWWDGDKGTDNGRESDNGDSGGWCSLMLAAMLALVAAVLWVVAGS